MFNTDLDALIPMLCITLTALATMGTEAFRGRDEQLPIGWWGLIGLGGAALSSTLLWNRNVVGYGVIVADNFGLFVTWILLQWCIQLAKEGQNGPSQNFTNADVREGCQNTRPALGMECHFSLSTACCTVRGAGTYIFSITSVSAASPFMQSICAAMVAVKVEKNCAGRELLITLKTSPMSCGSCPAYRSLSVIRWGAWPACSSQMLIPRK